MVKRIAAIAFIWLCTTAAWAVLGSTILFRTYNQDEKLKGMVVAIWGAPQKQYPAGAYYQEEVVRTEESEENGRKVKRTIRTKEWKLLPVEGSRVEAAFELEHRQKGLLWYSTYKVAFTGEYVIRNNTGEAQAVEYRLKFPAAQAVYDDLSLSVDGQPLEVVNENAVAKASGQLAAGQTAKLRVSYRSQGLESWQYVFDDQVAQVRDFQMRIKTNFREIDFPENSLAPSEKRETADGWELVWNYKNLVTGYHIGLTMPEKLQPGPVAGRISYFAPVSLFFFFFLMFIITTMRNIELHPMNYFFLAAAFFAFHLLLAYLVDHISIHLAFAICSAVSLFLVWSYLRIVVGPRFAAVESLLAQLIYLVGFSYAFFFKGYTGLTVTIGAILTLFVVMQMTARIRWAEKFSAGAPGEPRG
jgi:inner membrane protein involved in colicin E2 resistance